MSHYLSAQTLDRPLKGLNQRPIRAYLTQAPPDRADVLQLPSQTCSGLIQRWQLRPGLDLVIHDVEFREKTLVERSCSDNKTLLGLSFCLAGQIRGVSSMSRQEYQLQCGQASLGVMNGSSSSVEYAARQRVLLVHIHVRPDAISLLSQEATEQLPRSLRDAITGRDRRSVSEAEPPFYFQSDSMTPVMAATVKQLLHCPYQGLSQQIYIEGKTLELIGLYFDQLLSSNSWRQQASGLSSDDVDRIFYARDILLSRVANPPTLLALAHQIGLNDRKLKQGFRQVFGTTVFGYLHNHRMQQAQQLLLMPGAKIALVAQEVGYRNPEAFSVAFRRTFAISPKAYQMQQR